MCRTNKQKIEIKNYLGEASINIQLTDRDMILRGSYYESRLLSNVILLHSKINNLICESIYKYNTTIDIDSLKVSINKYISNGIRNLVFSIFGTDENYFKSRMILSIKFNRSNAVIIMLSYDYQSDKKRVDVSSAIRSDDISMIISNKELNPTYKHALLREMILSSTYNNGVLITDNHLDKIITDTVGWNESIPCLSLYNKLNTKESQHIIAQYEYIDMSLRTVINTIFDCKSIIGNGIYTTIILHDGRNIAYQQLRTDLKKYILIAHMLKLIYTINGAYRFIIEDTTFSTISDLATELMIRMMRDVSDRFDSGFIIISESDTVINMANDILISNDMLGINK